MTQGGLSRWSGRTTTYGSQEDDDVACRKACHRREVALGALLGNFHALRLSLIPRMPHLRGRGSIAAAKGVVEMRQIPEAAGKGDGSDGLMHMTRI
jgi:hypothetical protein